MKKILLIVFVVSFCFSSIFSQTNGSVDTVQLPVLSAEQNNILSEVNAKNLQVLELFKSKKYDDAFTIAKKSFESLVKAGLGDNLRAVVTISNLAEIYLIKSKESDAIALLQKVAAIYEKLGKSGQKGLEKTLRRLVSAYFVKPDLNNVEATYIKLKDLNQMVYKKNNRELAQILLDLGAVYRRQKKFDESEKAYREAISINDEILSKDEKEKREDLWDYRCFFYHKGFAKNNLSNASKEFEEFQRSRRPIVTTPVLMNAGIVNGKALNLVKPPYPDTAKDSRASGFSIVNVTIDESGNVINAKAYCGFAEFVEVTESAARASKFSPTFLNGVVVKVTGEIVYNFTAR